MELINDFLVNANSWANWPMFVLLIGGGLFLIFYSKLAPYRFFGHAIAITRGKYDDKNAKGDVSSLQALSAAVAATVGLGNISGVAIAIHDGGPGVVFWIWMTALIGMCIKFYSCSSVPLCSEVRILKENCREALCFISRKDWVRNISLWLFSFAFLVFLDFWASLRPINLRKPL